MDAGSITGSLDRIEAALDRIEAVARQAPVAAPTAGPVEQDDPDLARRHRELQAAVQTALARIDGLVGEPER